MKRSVLLFMGIFLVGVIADQATKMWASDALAVVIPSRYTHVQTLNVDVSEFGMTVEGFIKHRYPNDDPDALARTIRTSRLNGRKTKTTAVLRKDDSIEIRYRKVVVVSNFVEFEYLENPGAAFGSMAEETAWWRTPFLVAAPILALVMLIAMVRGLRMRDRIAVIALSMIASGAAGNLIDRVRFGYVIDFIVLKYTNNYRWPTFNIADALVTVGTILILLDILRRIVTKNSRVEAET